MKKLLVLFLLPYLSLGQNNYSEMLDSFMQKEASVNNFNGNILIAKSGDILYQKSFGYSNYNTQKLLDSNSKFELQSITKQFTAMGILLLIEKGKLSFTDSLRKFFPELPYSNVTIQQLLTHTSGLPDDIDLMSANWNHKILASNKDLIKTLADKKPPPNFQPGRKWEYSNTAFELLSSIIEKVSGMSYDDFINKYIFKPLQMNSSFATINPSGKHIPNYAYGFIYSDSLKKYILPVSIPELDFVFYLDGITGAGNIVSTTGDLLKWDRAIKNHRLISESTQNEMLSPQSIMDTASKKYYGYGVILGKNEIGNYIMHGGDWPGYHTMLFRYTEDDITIIVLSNNESNSTMLSGALAYIVTNREVVAPYKHRAIPIDTTIIGRYVGKYTVPGIPSPTRMKLTKKEGKLYYHFEKATSDIELKPESTTKFFNDNPGADFQIEFVIDSSKKVAKAFIIVNSMKKEIDKIE